MTTRRIVLPLATAPLGAAAIDRFIVFGGARGLDGWSAWVGSIRR